MKKYVFAFLSTALMISSIQSFKYIHTQEEAKDTIVKARLYIKNLIKQEYLSKFETVIKNIESAHLHILTAEEELYKMLKHQNSSYNENLRYALMLFKNGITASHELSKKASY